MTLVKRDLNGQLHWDETFKATSLKDFALQQNEAHSKARGVTDAGQWFIVVSEREVQRLDDFGKLIETYLSCELDPMHLI
jgi:hypothetical protein